MQIKLGIECKTLQYTPVYFQGFIQKKKAFWKKTFLLFYKLGQNGGREEQMR